MRKNNHVAKNHHVLKKQVTVKFYQAINFTCNAEEPICHHSGDQKTGTEACAPFYAFKLTVLCNQLSVRIMLTYLHVRFYHFSSIAAQAGPVALES